MTAMSKNRIRRQLRTLEDLIAYGNELDDERRASLFEYGDCVAEYVARHANGDAGSAAAVRTLCHGIASGSRLSGGFLYNLVRVARAFPSEQRDEYADRSWGWFLECVRERDPQAAAERYAGLSIDPSAQTFAAYCVAYVRATSTTPSSGWRPYWHPWGGSRVRPVCAPKPMPCSSDSTRLFGWRTKGRTRLCLDARKQRIASVVSNAGHSLWSGIVPPSRAGRVVARLLAEDMWSGWGVRTLRASHPTFNPFAYQRGSVWPHDNALIAAGCKHYGYDAAVGQIAHGIFDAANLFQGCRPPELMSGHQRKALGFPEQYLGVNIPQAWASGSAFLLLQAILGLRADAPRERLYLAPALPPC